MLKRELLKIANLRVKYAKVSLFGVGLMYLNTIPVFTVRKTPQTSFFVRLKVVL